MGLYIGIDPGLHGSVAAVSDTGAVIKLVDTPITQVKYGKKNKNVYVESEMVSILSSLNVDGAHLAIEKQFPMRGQGVSSTFSTGYGFGLWVGIATALKIPFELITSQRWKKVMMEGAAKEKAASCVVAQRLYPDAELFTKRGRAIDGRGDALLIGTYLMRTVNADTRP